MRFTKGLNKDADRSVQPEGTYRHLLNGNVTDESGVIKIEDGTELIANADVEISGDLVLPNGDILLFLEGQSAGIRIVRFDGENFDFIVKIAAFKDVDATNISATYSINNKGEVIVYWTDGVNPPRFINITNPPVNDFEDLNVPIEELNLFPHYDSSSVDFNLDQVSSGGNLKAGSYYLTFAYIDDDDTLTDYFLVTNPIFITSQNGYGADRDVVTNKSIKFTLNNLDTSYDRVRISSIRDTNVENVQDINISGGSISYNYTGNEDTTVGSLDEVVIDDPIYSKANALEQHNNQLYLGGLEGKELSKDEKISLQKAALNAQIEFNQITDKNRDFYNSEENIYNKTGFKRGEVYALYISFIKSDGRETEAFHIPGRTKDSSELDSGYDLKGNSSGGQYEYYQLYAKPNTNDLGYWENKKNETYPNEEPFSSTSDEDGNSYDGQNVRHHRMPGPTFGTKFTDGGGDIHPSGFKVNNISIPSELQNKIEGYKIYYAKKDTSDKLIVGQGSIHNGWLDKTPNYDSSTGTASNASIEITDVDASGTSDPSTYRVDVFGTGSSASDEDVFAVEFSNSKLSEGVEAVAEKLVDEINDAANSSSGDLQYVVAEDNSDLLGVVELYYTNPDTPDKFVGVTPNLIDQDGDSTTEIEYSSTSWDEPGSPEGYRPYQGKNGNSIDEVFDSDVYCTHGFDELFKHDNDGDGNYTGDVWGSKQDIGYVRPPELMIDRKNISSVTHVRGIYRLENFNNLFEEHESEINQKLYPYSAAISFVVSSDRESIRKVNAKSYVDKNQRNINLTNLGFSHDMDNLFGESKIILEFDNDYTKRGYRTVSDLCQVLSDVHVPFSNQTLVDTGVRGNIDSDGKGSKENIWGGDTYICPNHYKAHSLLSVYQNFQGSNPRWNENYNNVIREWILESFAQEMFESGSGGDGENVGCKNGIVEKIGDTSNMSSIPVPHGFIFEEIIESRVNTNFLYSGEEQYERVYPQQSINDGVVWPTISSISAIQPNNSQTECRIEASRWCDYFTKSDNYPKWNEMYEDLQDVKTSFPWSVNDVVESDNYNRVIRSSGDSESGRSKSFRRFVENDFEEVSSNRGDIIKLEEVNNNLVIHLERSLIQTRGRDRLQTQGANVFLGSGDIFNAKPNEVVSTDVGYAGLQNIQASTNCKYGYFFVDSEDEKVFQVNQSGVNELTSKKFGLHNFFRQQFNFSNVRVEYDPNRERIILTSDSDTLAFNPDLAIWSSFLSYKPDYIFRDLNNLYTYKDDSFYEHTESSSTIYGNNKKFSIKFSVPHQINHKVNFLWFNSFEYNNINNIPFDWVRIKNRNQDTGEIVLTPYSTNPSDITTRGNCRKIQGTWRINDLRVKDGSGNLPSWAYERKLEDDYHVVEMNSEDGDIKLKAAGLNVEQSIR